MVFGACVIASVGDVMSGDLRMWVRPVMSAELLSLGLVMMVVAFWGLCVLFVSMTRRLAGWEASFLMSASCVL